MEQVREYIPDLSQGVGTSKRNTRAGGGGAGAGWTQQKGQYKERLVSWLLRFQGIMGGCNKSRAYCGAQFVFLS